jgi:SAM-dependent methyltransferase
VARGSCRWPLSAVVVDIANVCAAGREIAVENQLADRITYHVADFLQDELPSGFGVVLVCDAGHSEALLRQVRAALNPGGRLVIVDQFAPSEGVVAPSWLYWGFLASLENPDFRLPTATEVHSRLERAGFQPLSERALPQDEVVRWSSDWVMIEARK